MTRVLLVALMLGLSFGSSSSLLGGDFNSSNSSSSKSSGLGIVNGRTTLPGEWEGTVMVIGENGDCLDLGLCSGAFIHPQVVMTAGHCCQAGVVKAICGGKDRAQPKFLARSVETAVLFDRINDFCLIRLDRAVSDVPIYEVATYVERGNGLIVGYGVSSSGYPQEGAGIQRDGDITITSVFTEDIYVTGRTGQTYQNACNGDSGGPLFVQKRGSAGDWVIAGVTSRGEVGCPINGRAIYASTIFAQNHNLILESSKKWFGSDSEIVPGRCPVSACCYGKDCLP